MSLLMAPLAAVFGQDAIFWLTPIAAAALVLFAFVIGRQLAGGVAGVTAAILTATSPIVLYQSVQPMNDIVTAALWLGAIALGRWSAIAGVMIGAAILVRPNLAPLAVVLALVPFLQFGINRQAGRALLQTIAGSLPGVLVLLWLNHALYGSVIGSGYGATADLFSARLLQRQPDQLFARAVPNPAHRPRARAAGAAGVRRRQAKGRGAAARFRGGRDDDLSVLQAIPGMVVLALPHPRDRRAADSCKRCHRAVAVTQRDGRIDSDPCRAARHRRHASGRRAAGVRAASHGGAVSRDRGAGPRSIAGQRGADHRVAERQHALPRRARNRDVGFARSGVARSRNRVAEIDEDSSHTSSSNVARSPTSARASAINPRSAGSTGRRGST